MSIFSNVGVALRKDALEQLPKEILDWLEEKADYEDLADCESRADTDRGRMFLLYDVRWDRTYPDVENFYQALDKLPLESYLVREACPEYPETDALDCGDWIDNPFKLRKYQTVELTWVEI